MLVYGVVNFVNCSNDGLRAFVDNFVNHFLPTMFVVYRKGVQQAISLKKAFLTCCDLDDKLLLQLLQIANQMMILNITENQFLLIFLKGEAIFSKLTSTSLFSHIYCIVVYQRPRSHFENPQIRDTKEL
jgi:hypothetical protein